MDRCYKACIRVEDLAVPLDGSVVLLCQSCEERVWSDPKSPTPADMEVVIVCLPCFAAANQMADQIMRRFAALVARINLN